MIAQLPAFIRRLTTALTLALAAQGAAHAGLVTGNWDPAFGAFLPNLSWQVRGEFQVSNDCSATDGDHIVGTAGCTSASVQNLWLRLFDNSIPGASAAVNFFNSSLDSNYWDLGAYSPTITQVRVQDGSVIGVDTSGVPAAQTLSYDFVNYYSSVTVAMGNLFFMDLNLDGPTLTCGYVNLSTPAGCRNAFNPLDPFTFPESPVSANTAQVEQFLVTYDSANTDTPKFTDEQGNALGASATGTGGSFTTPGPASRRQSVPEPGTLSLLLVALFAGLRRSRG